MATNMTGNVLES